MVKFPVYTNVFCSGNSVYVVGLQNINTNSLLRSYQGSSFKLTMHGMGFRYFIDGGLLNLKMACSHNIILPSASNIILRSKKNVLMVSSFFSNSCSLYSVMITKARIVNDYSFKGISLVEILNKKVSKNNAW
jgi:ribosomal protein L6P/L9E